jgi:transporter family protein
VTWIVYALGTAFALAVADFCLKLASGKVSSSLGLLLYGSCTFLTGLCWVTFDKIRGAEIHAQAQGIVAATVVGIAFSAVTIGLYATFGAGAPISLASPLVRLGGLILASMAGLVLLNEPLTWRYICGIVLAITGILLIITR